LLYRSTAKISVKTEKLDRLMAGIKWAPLQEITKGARMIKIRIGVGGGGSLKGQSHEMFKALFKCGLIGLGQERNR
jgi:hypothetical protein